MITSTSNERIKAARKLRFKRQREEAGLLLVEGVRLIDDAWQSGVRPVELFFLPEAAQQNQAVAALVRKLDVPAGFCQPVTSEVMATLTETVTPQGIVAVLPQPRLAWPNSPTLTLVLDQLREPGNTGTLLRSAEAAGVDCVLFTPATVDPFNDKVVRAAMGAHFRLPLSVCADWVTVRRMLPGGQALYLADAGAELLYDQVDWLAPAVLVVGGEAGGASAELRVLATPLRIPMHGAVESLNAAVAGAVVLFEAARQRRVGFAQP